MFQKRIVIFLVVTGFVFFIIIARLFSSQVINNSYYINQARKYATRIELLAEPRGRILDRNREVLVSNKLSFDLYFTPFRYFSSKQPESEMIGKLGKILKVKENDITSKIESIIQRIEKQAEGKSDRLKSQFIKQKQRDKYKLFAGLSLEQAVQIEAHPEIFTGFTISENILRHYLYNELACHLIGYTGPVWKEEYDKFIHDNYFRDIINPKVDNETYQTLVELGEFKDKSMGRSGIEKLHNKTLIGRYGVRLSEYDYTTRQKKELSRTDSIEPENLTLTIDLPLQKKMQEALKDKVGAGIVMDIYTGEILAMVSVPSFNPNELQPPVDNQTVEYIFKSPLKPLYNRAISGEYPPGSVFKIITTIDALEEGKITPNTSFNCTGYFSPMYKKFRCWIADYNREHGTLSLEDAIKYSCNVYFFNIGKLTGVEAILKWANIFGFGEKTGVDLPAENKGRLPKLSRSGGTENWSLSETLNLSIGQGDLMVTPLQVVRMLSALVNGGVLVRPRITRDSRPDVQKKISLSATTIRHLLQGLYKVVHSEGGTAYNTKMRNFSSAGKTGSAEVWGKKPHAWFAGFAPYEKPRIAFVVVVEHGGKGSEAAAPLAAHFLPEALAINLTTKE
jgi:penicillin-binding protein 2